MQPGPLLCRPPLRLTFLCPFAVLCLSRHDVCEDGALQFDSHVATLSQDVWAFRPPLPKVGAQFLMGKPGCDNRIAYEFRKAGMRVNNPAYVPPSTSVFL